MGGEAPWPKWGTTKQSFGKVPSPQESADYGQSLTLDPTDVVVLTFPKTGTTWMQNICEQLRCGGTGFDHFSEITEVQPWIERLHEINQKLEDSPGPIRCFKSHQLPSAINPGAKYLSLCRNPDDVLLSWFGFMSQKIAPWRTKFVDANGYIKLGGEEEFASNAIFGTNIWEYYVQLWEIRNEPNVLVLCYEDMKKDGPEYKTFLPYIAKLVGIEFSSKEEEMELYKKVAKYVSREEMSKNADKFDDSFIDKKLREDDRAVRRGLPEFVHVAKVDTHKGKKPTLDDETKEWMQKKWTEKVTPFTGHATYEEFAKDIAAAVLAKPL